MLLFQLWLLQGQIVQSGDMAVTPTTSGQSLGYAAVFIPVAES